MELWTALTVEGLVSVLMQVMGPLQVSKKLCVLEHVIMQSAYAESKEEEVLYS